MEQEKDARNRQPGEAQEDRRQEEETLAGEVGQEEELAGRENLMINWEDESKYVEVSGRDKRR